MVEILLVDLGGIGVIGGCIGFWCIPENPAYILSGIKRAQGNDCTLVLYPQGEPVDVIMAEMTDHEDPCRRIPHHLPVQAPGYPVDLKEFKGNIFRTKFAVCLNSTFEFFFLCRCQSGIFFLLHDYHGPRVRLPKRYSCRQQVNSSIVTGPGAGAPPAAWS